MAPAGETQTMTAAAPEGHRAKKGLLAQELAPQQLVLQREECPTTQQQSVAWIKTCRRNRPETRGSGWRGPDDQHPSAVNKDSFLADEYDHVKATLHATKNRDRVEIIHMVGTRYSTLL